MIERLAVEDIVMLDELQARAALSNEVVADYTDALERGEELPPVSVFLIDAAPYLVDGYHTLAATRASGRAFISAVVVGSGALAAAQLHAFKANASHGLRRSSADKRRVVRLALQHPMLHDASLREIAKRCRVSHSLVKQIRDEQERPALPEEPAAEAPAAAAPAAPPDQQEPAGQREPEDRGAAAPEDPCVTAETILRDALARTRRVLADAPVTRDAVTRHAKQAIAEARRMQMIECPRCSGRGCTICMNRGKVSRHIAESVR